MASQREWRAADWLGGRGAALSRELRAGSWRAFEDLHALGLVRAIGVSNYLPQHLLELCRSPSTRVLPAVLQSEHHPFFSNAAVRRVCEQHGIHMQAYGPLSGGQAERARGVRGVEHATVRAVAAEARCTPAQAVLAWAMARGVSVLPKSHRREGVAENAASARVELSAAMMRKLDGLETGTPCYWDPACVEQLDTFNVYMDKEALKREIGQ